MDTLLTDRMKPPPRTLRQWQKLYPDDPERAEAHYEVEEFFLRRLAVACANA